MIEIEIRHLGDHEILHAMPVGKRDKSLPVVVFYHGFTSSKLVYSYFAVALAQAGFRVVMPDAPDHGARFTGNEQARLGQFWQILHGSLTEFAGLRDALYGAGLVAGNRLAVAGASMGGMTALGIMTHHPEVKSVACLMGSGYFTSLAKTLFPPQDLAEITARLEEWEVTRALPRLADRPPDGHPAPDHRSRAHIRRDRSGHRQLKCSLSAGFWPGRRGSCRIAFLLPRGFS